MGGPWLLLWKRQTQAYEYEYFCTGESMKHDDY